MGEGVAVRRLAAAGAGGEPAALWLPGARRAGDAGRRHLPRERGPAAQALDRGAAGPEPVGRRTVDVRRQRVVAPAAHGRRGRRDRLAAARRAGGRGARARRPRSRWPGGGWRCWATRPRSPRSRRASSSPTRARAGRAGSSRASAPRSTSSTTPRSPPGRWPATTPSWWPTARRPRSRPRRWRRSPPSSPRAGPTSAGARGASPWRAPPASRRRRSRPARPPIWIPGAAVAVGSSVVVDNDDPLIVGGHVVAAYGAVLSGWTLGLAGGAPGDPRRAASARARRPLRLRSRLPRRPARAPRRCSRAR